MLQRVGSMKNPLDYQISKYDAVPPLCSMTRAIGSKGKIPPCSLPVISPCIVGLLRLRWSLRKGWNLFAENGSICDNGGGSSKRQENKTLLCGLKRSNPGIKKSIFNNIHAVFQIRCPVAKKRYRALIFGAI